MADVTPPIDPTPQENGGSDYKSIEEQLKLAKIAIENAISQSDLAGPLALKGYDAPEMAAAQTLYANAEALYLAQKDKYGSKVGAKDDFDALRAEIEDDYNDHVELARIALRHNRGDLEKLQMNGKRKQSISGWLAQAKAFYTNSLGSADIMAALAKKGVAQIDLEGTQAKIVELEKKEATKFQMRGQAQSATADRDNAIDELLTWHKDFIDTARVTFRKNPQLLEKLGIVVKV